MSIFSRIFKRDPAKEESRNFVDLGLPSGTLWADRNVGDDNVCSVELLMDRASVSGTIPTYEQCYELIEQCEFSTVIADNNGTMVNCVRVLGPNGNAIMFPVSSEVDEAGNGMAVSCWCGEEVGEFSPFMLFQLVPIGVFDFQKLTNITIGMTSTSTHKMLRNVK